MTTFNVSELVFTVRGTEFRKDTSTWTSDMMARAAAHGLKQMVGDAAAGKSGDDAESAIKSAFARIDEWACEEARTRLPAAAALFVAEAKLYLRARGVPSKIVATIKTEQDALAEIDTYIGAAGEHRGLSPAAIKEAYDTRITAIRDIVATRLAAASNAGDL